MTGLSSKSKQLSLVVEDISGQTPAGTGGYPDALADPANARIQVEDVSMQPDIEFEENDSTSASITPGRKTPGRKRMTLNASVKMRGTNGGTFADGPPQWGKLLKACNFTEKPGGYFELTGPFLNTIPGQTDAPFRHGEWVRGNTTQRARVVHDTHDGATRLYFVDRTGDFPVGAIVVGLSSGAACTIGNTVDDAHYSWWPVSKTLKSLTVADLSAAQAAELTVGTIIRGKVTKATAIIEEAAENGDTEIVYSPAGGQFNDSEAIDKLGPGTQYDTVATSAADPVFIQGHTVSARLNEAGLAETGVGFSGDVSIAMEVSKPWTMEFTMTGGFLDTGDRPEIAGINFENTVPPSWEGVETSIATNEDATTDGIIDEETICISEANVTLGNTPSEILCANAPGGVLGSRVSARAGTFSMNPLALPNAQVPFSENLYGGKVMRFRTGVGTIPGNMFVASIPGAQLTGLDRGAREDILSFDVQCDLTGGNNWNLLGAEPTIDSTGGDNEFVLTYVTNP